MIGAVQTNLFRSLFKSAALGLALCTALSVSAHNLPGGTESWKSTCDGQRCTLTGDIPHGDEGSPRHMSIVVALERSGKVDSVTFQLPPDADKGQLFAVTFADTVKDASGNWTVKLVPDATRILNVQDCSSSCVVTLPNGMIPAGDGAAAYDFGQAMAAHNLLLMFYFSHGERIRASAALFRYKAEIQTALRQLP